MSQSLFISEPMRRLFQEIEFVPQMVFSSPAIKPWRTLSDRENCVWDIATSDGSTVRLHVKRYPPRRDDPAGTEAEAIQRLQTAKIPTVDIAAWGRLGDGRSFVLLNDLTGFQAADKLVASGVAFDWISDATADLAAHLHILNLHHRDLYLCHFFAKVEKDSVDVRLIDAARVRPIPMLTRRHWIVKDLAQFWFSTTQLPIDDAHRDAWLKRYTQYRQLADIAKCKRSIERKSSAIASHDAKLRLREPGRNISIPDALAEAAAGSVGNAATSLAAAPD